MSLTSISVYRDWPDRSRRIRNLAKAQWYVGLSTVVFVFLLSFLIQRSTLVSPRQWLLAIGIADLAYLAGAGWIVAVVAPDKRHQQGALFLVLTIAALTSVGLTGSRSTGGILVPFSLTMSFALLLVIPLISLFTVFRLPAVGLLPRPPRRQIWVADSTIGVLVGASITLLWLLAFSYLHDTQPLLPLRMQGIPLLSLVLYLGALHPIAEEFFFRGLIVRQLYFHFRRSFWAATMGALALQLPFYFIHARMAGSAGEIALLLVMPSLLAVSNAVLYVWRSTLLPPVLCNATAHAALLFMTFGHQGVV